jgi:protein-S-isoprenylcysteine O-methyltransferase Ste14
MVAATGFFLAHRKQYQGLLENRLSNLAVVIVYCLLCVLLAGLPSDPDVLAPLAFFTEPPARIGYSVIGLILIGISALIWIAALRQRKALSGQDVKSGLLTSGLCRHFRHPLYTAMVWVSLGLALALGNWDGLLMIPAIFLVNAAEAFLEERCDVGVRFSSQYAEYRRQTRMFGPLWVWISLAVVLVAVPVAAHLL